MLIAKEWLIGLALGAFPLAAQAPASASVRGQVFDSLSNHALEHATVQLVSVDSSLRRITVATDAAGRFDAAHVPAGTYLIGFYHPRLDSLGLEVMPRRVTAGGQTITADLATPSSSTLIASLCGPSSAARTVVFGVARSGDDGRVLSGASIAATWTAPLGGGQLAYGELSMGDTSKADGSYVLCDLPPNTVSEVVGAHGSDTTGAAFVRFDSSRVVHLDLTVASRGYGRVIGQILEPNGRPVRGRIGLLNGGHDVVTDESGRFTLDSLPAGTQTLLARAIAYPPREITAAVSPHATSFLEVSMSKTVMLPTMISLAERNDAIVAAFREAKRRSGAGYFVEAVAPPGYDPGVPAMGYARGLPGVITVPCRFGCYSDNIAMLHMNKNGDRPAQPGPDGKIQTEMANYCTPGIAKLGPGSLDDPRDIVGVEVYTREIEIPARYGSDFGDCGLIIVWTKKHIPT